jgi:phasin
MQARKTAMPRDQQLEIPEELRQLAEENVERARKLYLQFMDGVSQVMRAWSTPSADTASPAFNEVREKAIKITRENADAAFSLAKDVANAKDLQELVTLQTRYVQSQLKWYAQQTQEFGRLMAEAFTAPQAQPSPTGGQAAAPAPQNQQSGDQASPGTVGTGENICPQCGGTGKIEGKTCRNCAGTGRIVEGIGGG